MRGDDSPHPPRNPSPLTHARNPSLIPVTPYAPRPCSPPKPKPTPPLPLRVFTFATWMSGLSSDSSGQGIPGRVLGGRGSWRWCRCSVFCGRQVQCAGRTGVMRP
uniref:Uncharacterized protein n=1 Tax=Knipowitschia caucasica TaxID=637954 RepID=A0AAV2M582_KNICA